MWNVQRSPLFEYGRAHGQRPKRTALAGRAKSLARLDYGLLRFASYAVYLFMGLRPAYRDSQEIKEERDGVMGRFDEIRSLG
jgi:hypothetical protein